MYNCIQLNELNTNPRISDISLELLREYYEIYLNPFEYHYNVIDETNQYHIELRFDQENLCHLLGLESIVKYNINKNELCNYKGQKGWDNIKDGSITMKLLKDINKNRFKSGKDKMVFFYLVPNLIKTPKAIYFDNSLIEPPTRIQSKIIFFNEYFNSILHLGIEPNDDNLYYVPRTLLIERITDKNDGTKYTKDQQQIELEVKSRVIML